MYSGSQKFLGYEGWGNVLKNGVMSLNPWLIYYPRAQHVFKHLRLKGWMIICNMRGLIIEEIMIKLMVWLLGFDDFGNLLPVWVEFL